LGAAERTITGHIDLLQVRNGAVHVLDYKPDARTNKPIAQLAIYTLALTRLVPDLKLFDIKCASFKRGGVLRVLPAHALCAPATGTGYGQETTRLIRRLPWSWRSLRPLAASLATAPKR
jgi:hypothetical protein